MEEQNKGGRSRREGKKEGRKGRRERGSKGGWERRRHVNEWREDDRIMGERWMDEWIDGWIDRWMATEIS